MIKSAAIFRNYSIGTKLGIGFIALILITLLVSAISFLTANLTQNAVEETQAAEREATLADNIVIELLQARQREKDFLLRYQNQGYQAAYDQYILPYEQHIENIQQTIEQLSAAHPEATDADFEILANLYLIDTLNFQYHETFIDVVSDAIQRRGSENSGQIGDMNFTLEVLQQETGSTSFSDETERLIEQFQIYKQATEPGASTLTEFSLVHTDIRASVLEQILTLRTNIQVANLPDGQQDNLLALVNNFSITFNRFSDSAIEIAQEIDNVRVRAESIEPVAQDISRLAGLRADETNTDLNNIQQSMRLVQIAALCIALLLSSILIFLVRQSITVPLIELSSAAEKIAQGNYSHQVAITTNDEFGQLGLAFNHMSSAVQERTNELMHSNEQLRTAQQLAEENSRLKSEFLATMSHELRTPLNAIEGFTSIMLGNMGVELNPQARKMLERVSINSKRLLNLINDFLDLSRIESGRLEMANTPINVPQVAERWHEQLSGLAATKQLDFAVQVDPELPEVIYGDEEAISKVVLNLLSNAIKFTHEGGVDLNIGVRDSMWTIQVSDTGIGIPPHAREYIFDEFRQVDQSSKRLYGGTGLGLAIVQKMTRAMGGTIALKSEVGKGSTFTIALPIQRTPAQG